ncbi:MAG TPA: phytanoyl-CoA dioxygenase family protein [Chitinophagaceae bacterium]
MNNSRPIFTDPEKQKEFDARGWTKIRLFDETDVQKLRELYFSLDKMEKNKGGFYVGLDNANKQQVKEVRDTIRELFLKKGGHHFDRIKIFTSSFVTKEPNPVGVVPPHQDWSFTDESQFDSATVWIALQDTDINNGTLGFINGSNHFFRSPRPSPSPQAKSLISDHLYTMFPWLEIVDLQPGEALIFHNSTIHGSPPNTSGDLRIAAGVGISQAEAPLWHYYQLPGTSPQEMICLEVDEEFYIQNNNTSLSKMYDEGKSPSEYKVRSRTVRETEQFTSAEIVDMIQAVPGNRYNGVLVEKMQQIFGHRPAPSVTPAGTQNVVAEQSAAKVYTLKNIIAEIRWKFTKLSKYLLNLKS